MNKKLIIGAVIVVVILAVGSFVLQNSSQAPGGAEPSDSRITKTEWGVYFEKGNDWKVKSNDASQVALEQVAGGFIGDVMIISFVSAASLTDTDAKFGSVTYSFDSQKGEWMKTSNEVEAPAGPTIATPDSYTSDNLPVFRGTQRWRTYIIPLSEDSFIKMNITGSGNYEALDKLVKTLRKIN